MAVNHSVFREIVAALGKNVQLVAVSKTKPLSDIQEIYGMGQRDFGENYVQELVEKQKQLPNEIRWHYLGHLQTNKVKQIAPFVHLIQAVDSVRLLEEIDKQARKCNRIIDCLLQVHIAKEETKFGFDEKELNSLFVSDGTILPGMKNIRVRGLMGMATLTEDNNLIREEFRQLHSLFQSFHKGLVFGDAFDTLSMGMSSDYRIAIEQGSTMVRIGSLLFGKRK